MWKAFELARDIEFSHFVLESDFQVLLQQIKSGSGSFSPIGHIIESLDQLISSFPLLSIQHVNTKFNVPTHLLAKHACKT